MALEPCKHRGVDRLAVDVDTHAMSAAWERAAHHLAAAHEPLLDLGGIGGRDGAVPAAVEHEHRRADRRQLIAHVLEQAGELVDRAHRTQAVRVQLVDGLEVVEVDVIAGAVPAHHTAGDRDGPGREPRDPHRGGKRRHGGDAQVGCGKVQCDGATHGLPGHHHLVALGEQHVELLLRRVCPVLPGGGFERLGRRGVAGQGWTVTAKPVGGEMLAEAAQLRGAPREAVQEEHAAASRAECPGADDAGVERRQAASGHGRPSICAARG